MTIKVTTTDGRTVEFPAGTDTATIESVMRSTFGGPKEEKKSSMGMLESFGRGITSGALMGFEDELGLADKAKQAEAKENPVSNFAGNLVGGVGTALAATLLPGAQPVAGAKWANVGRTIYNGARGLLAAGSPATVGQAAKEGVKLGATYGAISGAGHAESGERIKGATEGAVAGGMIGGVLGPASYKIGEKLAIARAAKSEMANADTASLSAIDRALARDGIDPSVLRAQIEVPQYGKLATDQISDLAERVGRGEPLADVAKSLGIGEPAARKAIAAFQDRNAAPLSIVDRARMTGVAGGENTSWTLRAGMASPGRGRAEAAEALTLRQMEQPARIVQSVDDIVSAGNPQQRMAAMKQAERGAYDNAYNQQQPFNIAPSIDAVEQGFANRQTGIAKEMQRAAELFSEKTPGRPPQFEPFKRLDHFQEAKLDLDQMIAQSMNMGRPTPLTRQLTKFKTDLMNEVSTTNPAWRQANDLFAENATARRLFQDFETTGFRITADSKRELASIADAHAVMRSTKATPEAKAAATAQVQMARDGLGEAIKSAVMNKSETGDHVGKFLTPAGQQFITTILGKKDGAAFITALRKEEAITRSYRGLGGSQTTPLREAIDELNGPPLLASSLDMMNPRALVQALITKGAAKLSEARNNRMVPMLVDADPLKQLGMLRDLQTMRKARSTGGSNALRYVPGVSNSLQESARPAPRGMVR